MRLFRGQLLFIVSNNSFPSFLFVLLLYWKLKKQLKSKHSEIVFTFLVGLKIEDINFDIEISSYFCKVWSISCGICFWTDRVGNVTTYMRNCHFQWTRRCSAEEVRIGEAAQNFLHYFFNLLMQFDRITVVLIFGNIPYESRFTSNIHRWPRANSLGGISPSRASVNSFCRRIYTKELLELLQTHRPSYNQRYSFKSHNP